MYHLMRIGIGIGVYLIPIRSFSLGKAWMVPHLWKVFPRTLATFTFTINDRNALEVKSSSSRKLARKPSRIPKKLVATPVNVDLSITESPEIEQLVEAVAQPGTSNRSKYSFFVNVVTKTLSLQLKQYQSATIKLNL